MACAYLSRILSTVGIDRGAFTDCGFCFVGVVAVETASEETVALFAFLSLPGG
jgi:hypothetical protein